MDQADATNIASQRQYNVLIIKDAICRHVCRNFAHAGVGLRIKNAILNILDRDQTVFTVSGESPAFERKARFELNKIIELANCPPLRDLPQRRLHQPAALMAREAEVDEPLAVEPKGHLLQDLDAPLAVLDQVVVGGEDAGDAVVDGCCPDGTVVCLLFAPKRSTFVSGSSEN